MLRSFCFSLFLAVVLFPLSAQEVDQELFEKANELAQKYIITDGHVDLPYRLRVQNFQLTREYIGIPISTEKGDFDYERSKQGGLDAPFMSIFIPASYQRDGGAAALADTLIDMVEGIVKAHPDKFALAPTVKSVKKNFKKGLISLPMGMENGAPIEGKLENIAYFHGRGIRYITLTHSKDNHICDSSYDTTGTWNGLSPFGREVVAEMNRVGIMIDISHVSDSTFYQVMELTQTPVIASHSSARKYTPGFERNMNDDMIVKMKENNGVIQINFGSTFVDGEVAANRKKLGDDINALLESKGLTREDEASKAVIDEFMEINRDKYFADVQIVANHIDHVVHLAGIDHVAFGSDYDGVGDSLPTGLKDVSTYPNLIYELLKRGYSEKDIKKICFANVERVWKAVEKFAD